MILQVSVIVHIFADMKKTVVMLMLSLALCSCGSRRERAAEKVREVEAGERAMLLGAFTEPRPVTPEDLEVFEAAIAEYDPSTDSQARPVYVPTSVSTQVVSGVNYLFECDDNTPGADRPKIQILVYRPLPGQGEPLVKLQNPHN